MRLHGIEQSMKQHMSVTAAGFNVEKVQYKNVLFTVWDVGGQEKLRPLWRHYFNNTDGLIYVVDSQDRERVNRAASEFKVRPNCTCSMTLRLRPSKGLYPAKTGTWSINRSACALQEVPSV